MVFAECAVSADQCEAEVRWVEEQAKHDSRIRAIIAQATLERGAAVLPVLEHLKRSTPLLRGVRRIVEFEPELDFCLQPAFIEGVRVAGSLGLSVDMCVNYRHMEYLERFADLIGNIPLMLDHCGKPAIREGHIEPWRTQLRAVADYPHVMCKLSGLPGEADHRTWSAAQIQPFVEAVVDAFGFERVVYGGDWPACLPANSLAEWVNVLDRVFSGVPLHDLRRVYRDNAIRFYRLDLGT
jgi:L-fuconolactonase